MSAEQSGSPPTALGSDREFSEEIIRGQLATVLASPEFARRPVLRNFLSFVVEKALAGRSHEIKGYTVATEVFGRNENFDGQKDSVVRIQAGRLRRALERYYLSSGAQDPVKIEIPKGSYEPRFHRLSTPESGKGGSRPERGGPAFTLSHGPSVAVMPLVNLTGDPGQEYFTDGLTEEFTRELARFQNLRVVASHSTLQMKGVKACAREMGQRLGARFLVEGSVRKEADQVKISVGLIDTTTGLQIWGEQYRRELRAESLITLQEDIGRRVASKVGDLFGIISTQLSKESQKKPPGTLTTYDALLRYHHYQTSLSAEAFARAFKALEDAAVEEPESGLAWSLLANLYANNYALGHSQMKTTLETAMAMARKGASLDPGNQLVRAILAFVLFLQNDKDNFFREAEECVALNPNNPAIIGFIGWATALYGDWEHGLALMEKGIELNPHFPGWYHLAPYFDCYRQGRYSEAFREARQFNMAQLFWDPLLQAAALGQMGRESEAGSEIDRLLVLRPDFPTCGSRLIGFYVKTPSLIEATLDGLRKAGLKT
jgi:adenylate cyclase